MTTTFDRRRFLRRGALAGGALLAAGMLPAKAVAAAAPPDADLAYLRLLVGAELLAVDFQVQTLASKGLSAGAARVVKQMLADERAHLSGLSTLLADAGQVAATADDVDFSYPKGSFGSQARTLRLAASIESLTLGAYLGAVESLQTPELRLPIGQIAASEAQHAGALAALVGKPVIGRAFAPALPIDAVSAALDEYES